MVDIRINAAGRRINGFRACTVDFAFFDALEHHSQITSRDVQSLAQHSRCPLSASGARKLLSRWKQRGLIYIEYNRDRRAVARPNGKFIRLGAPNRTTNRTHGDASGTPARSSETGGLAPGSCQRANGTRDPRSGMWGLPDADLLVVSNVETHALRDARPRQSRDVGHREPSFRDLISRLAHTALEWAEDAGHQKQMGGE